MYQPISTYRIQFHKDFTFADLKKIIPCIHRLGIRTIYASPIFEAENGSTHGYDQVNPLRINPEIGTLEELEEIHEELKPLGIGWLQDIVPNHMAFSCRNRWLMDVLEQGRDSPYAGYFDTLPEAGNQLMAPFLGDTLEKVIDKKEISITRQEGGWQLKYFDNYFPLNSESIRGYDAATLAQAQEQPQLLRSILDQQYYRLCHWQETNRHINYRRFFTVNGLICLNAQQEFVFENTHALAFSLLKKGVFNGLRVDHIDGLLDPEKYLNRLRQAAGTDAYIVVEKILETGEALPVSWPVQGTTGYGFLAQVNNLLTSGKSKKDFTLFYNRLTGNKKEVPQQLVEKKKWILKNRMQGELENLSKWFLDLVPGVAFEQMKSAVAYLLLLLPQYRFYGNKMPLSLQEQDDLKSVFRHAKTASPDLKNTLTLIESALLQKTLKHDAAYNKKALYAYQRLMQLSGPLMAKGMEDTLMYTYNRFIGHNEVGDSPENFGMSVAAFHDAMQDRRRHWPLALNALATHDTKRGSDARALLQVLPAIPADWQETVNKWRRMNAPLKQDNAPDANVEYFIYQTLFASWPLNPLEDSGYEARLIPYLEKAQREAKLYTNWAKPDEAYEANVADFAKKLLSPDHAFISSFLSFRKKYQDFGMLNGLVQVLLQTTCPGVPDVYQGNELWDQSFVDPDNRRAVDYPLREEMLHAASAKTWQDLWDSRLNGAVKLKLLQQLLQLRQSNPELFASGTYLPLRAAGAHAAHVIAFARKYKNDWLLVVAGLNLPEISETPDNIDWADTVVHLPPGLAGNVQNDLTSAASQQDFILLRDLFGSLPLYFKIVSEAPKKRGAGVLAAVSSLPSHFGMGDLGPEAHRFAELLGQQGWQYWQLLPLSPVSAGSSFSPYSSYSTLAANPLFISPEILLENNLLKKRDLKKARLTAKGNIAYPKAEKTRENLLKQAWQNYQSGSFAELKSKVIAFNEAEAWWLYDFALYCALKEHFSDAPWFEWPAPFRQREKEPLLNFATAHAEKLAFYKWQQALVTFQIRDLRLTCQQNGVALIGDLPFYASYDSVDVWTQQSLFSIDDAGRLTGMAGVPPDYFSADGQLWGMPTFCWEKMKADGFQWWIRRLKKNLEYCDLLRIDHFRALAAYWEVPAGQTTAINGKWKKGPGVAFFKAVKEALGDLPFIAEDLGDQMADVYKLRDEVDLPGMAVLQFAFGPDLPKSVHAPHQYKRNLVVYTGTHDNNTLLGWYRKDAEAADKKRLAAYADSRITEKNLPETAARLALGSVARIAVFPLQDLLRLNETARMNIPGTAAGNWGWRLSKPVKAGQLSWLKDMLRLYGRS